MLSNFPAMRRESVAPQLIESIIPQLHDLLMDAAALIAEQECGERASIFDVERIAFDLQAALSDFLTLSPIPIRGVRDMLHFHQLDALHAAAYFGVELDYRTREDDSEVETIVSTPAPYSPAIVTPHIVVDNRPAKPTRTLEEIKREVDNRRRPEIQFVQHSPQADQRALVIERATLAQQRVDDQRIEDGLKRESQLDDHNERDLKPLGVLPLPPLKPDTSLPKLRQRTCANERCRKKYMPKHSTQKYCCDTCRTTTWHRQFGRKKSK